MLTKLVTTDWREKCVPQELVDAILVPIPTLMKVVGKEMARVVYVRLHRKGQLKRNTPNHGVV